MTKDKEELIAKAREVKEKGKKILCGVNAANNARIARIARKILAERVVGKQNG